MQAFARSAIITATANGELPERGEIVPHIAALPLIGPVPILSPEAASAAFFEAQERDPGLATMLSELLSAAGPAIGRMSDDELRSRSGGSEITDRERWQAFVSAAGQFLIGQVLHTYGGTLKEIREIEKFFSGPTAGEPHGGDEGQLPAA